MMSTIMCHWTLCWTKWTDFTMLQLIFVRLILILPSHVSKPPIQWLQGALSPLIKRPESEADHPTPSSTAVKDDAAISPLPRTSSWCHALLIKYREDFTFTSRLGLHTGQHKHRTNAHRHPCTKWDSNRTNRVHVSDRAATVIDYDYY
jgi:hypothetical protein